MTQSQPHRDSVLRRSSCSLEIPLFTLHNALMETRQSIISKESGVLMLEKFEPIPLGTTLDLLDNNKNTESLIFDKSEFTFLSSQAKEEVEENLCTEHQQEGSKQAYEEYDEETRIITMAHPGPWDVICGRNHGCGCTIGNKRFRMTVTMNLQRYEDAPTRDAKTQLIKEVAAMLEDEAGARFLRPLGNCKYLVLDEKQVREKVGHAIRDTIKQNQKAARVSCVKKRSSVANSKK